MHESIPNMGFKHMGGAGWGWDWEYPDKIEEIGRAFNSPADSLRKAMNWIYQPQWDEMMHWSRLDINTA